MPRPVFKRNYLHTKELAKVLGISDSTIAKARRKNPKLYPRDWEPGTRCKYTESDMVEIRRLLIPKK